MAKKFYWLKMETDYLSSPKIKKLRKIAGGDTYTIIYLKMQLLSVKNGGFLEYSGIEPSFAEEIALILDEDEDNVKVTVNFLESMGLLVSGENGEFLLPEAAEKIGSESESAERVRRFRANRALPCNASVTSCNTEKEKDEDKEPEIYSETEIDQKEKSDENRPSSSSVPYEEIKNIYNSICTSYPKCTVLSEQRKKAIKARFNTGYTIDDFRTIFEKAESSKFLKGANDRNWRANFDWILKDGNMAKILEGNYDQFEKKAVNKPELPRISTEHHLPTTAERYGWDDDEYDGLGEV